MKCIIYATVTTSQLLFTLGCKIIRLAVSLELKVHTVYDHATITYEGEDKACCLSATTVHLCALKAEGTPLRSSTTTSAK